MYYPYFKAVCVDVRSADSMAHEILHMIDYTSIANSSLSSLMNFRSFTSIFGNVGVKETKVVANVSVNTTISTKIASKVENLMIFVEKSSGQLSLF